VKTKGDAWVGFDNRLRAKKIRNGILAEMGVRVVENNTSV
jgi:hypothetical protein